MSADTTFETSAIARAALSVAQDAKPYSAKEWLTFRLGEEEYGMDILSVQEIRSYEAPTRIAKMPGYVKGVVDLRGVIVPILDLRMKLGMTDLRYDGLTVTVVLSVHGSTVGVVVDSVSDVLELSPGQIKPFPEMASSVESRFITGIGSFQTDGCERMLILLDIDALVASMKVTDLASESPVAA